MKNKSFLLISVLSVAALFSCNSNKSIDDSHKFCIIGKNIFNVNDTEDGKVFKDIFSSFNLKFIKNNYNPYISVDDGLNLFTKFVGFSEEQKKTFKIDYSTDKDVTLSRTFTYISQPLDDREPTKRSITGYARFNVNSNSVSIKSFSYLACYKNAVGGSDLIFTGDSNPKEVNLINHVANSSNFKEGHTTTFCFDDYNLDIQSISGKVYIPLQVYSDMFLANIGLAASYNGKDAFLLEGPELVSVDPNTGVSSYTEVGKVFYDPDQSFKDKSKDLKQYSYNCLTFALDFNYGLKSQHGITNFPTYLEDSGIKDEYLNDSEYYALGLLTIREFSDFHSAPSNPGFLEGLDAKSVGMTDFPTEVLKFQFEQLETLGYRSKVYSNGSENESNFDYNYPPCYEEFNSVSKEKTDIGQGDTAIITFDRFFSKHFDDVDGLYKKGVNTIVNEFNANMPNSEKVDTIELLIYANHAIHSNNKIKNVILDLSLNGGGQADAAAMVLSFLNYGTINLRFVADGTVGTVQYNADLNLDHEYTDDQSKGINCDTISPNKYNICCVTNKFSFSCGNLVPCMLKESGKYHLIGEQSGGGACSVCSLFTASGVHFQVSSNHQLCFRKNGSYYDIDRGAEVDYHFNDNSIFYGDYKIEGEKIIGENARKKLIEIADRFNIEIKAE